MRELCHNCGSQTGNKGEHTTKNGKKICRACQKYRIIEKSIQIKELARRAINSIDSALQPDFAEIQ